MDHSLEIPTLAVPRFKLIRRLRLLTRNPLAMIGTLILLFWIVIAIIGPSIAPYGENDMEANAAWKAPSARHIMGTDNWGRDNFSRLLIGARQMVVLPTVSIA